MLRFAADFFRSRTIVDGVELADFKPTIAEMNKIVFRHSLRRARNFFVPNSPHISER
jgi:hypothetical protein